MDSPYMTIKEVAEYLRISEATVRNWTYKRNFPRPIKIGQAINARALWSRSMVDEWFEQKRKEQAK